MHAHLALTTQTLPGNLIFTLAPEQASTLLSNRPVCYERAGFRFDVGSAGVNEILTERQREV